MNLKKPPNVKEMLRKSAASNTWAAILINAYFCESPLKSYKIG